LSFERFRLTVEKGPDQGRSAESEQAEFSIGTAPGNQLVLTDETVSRHHCTITATEDGFLLTDLGSMNATRLGGFRVQSGYLKSGVSVVVGRTKLRFERLAEQIREPLSEQDSFGRALGRSDAMRRIFALLPRVAAAQSTVLLEGETGTGKGLLAEAIHEASTRAEGPFVVVDCAAIPTNLVESELFGHVKGAFTGAQEQRTGAFESASRGTIFLDEIGELPLDTQPKLLRALEERMVKPVGADQPIKLDVRVLAATNRDLRDQVNQGNFRSDLFYRLNVVRLRIAPLRERPEDIELLCEHFYHQFCPAEPRPPQSLLESLRRQSWPGNVRELRSAIERAVLLGDLGLEDHGDTLQGGTEPSAALADAPDASFDPAVSFRAAKDGVIARWERAYLTSLTQQFQGNLSKAARAARMDRNHLRELLKKHKLSPKSSK